MDSQGKYCSTDLDQHFLCKQRAEELQQENERLRGLPEKCYEDAYRDAIQVLGSFCVDEATNEPFDLIAALIRTLKVRMEIRRNTNTLPLLEALAADREKDPCVAAGYHVCAPFCGNKALAADQDKP